MKLYERTSMEGLFLMLLTQSPAVAPGAPQPPPPPPLALRVGHAHIDDMDVAMLRCWLEVGVLPRQDIAASERDDLDLVAAVLGRWCGRDVEDFQVTPEAQDRKRSGSRCVQRKTSSVNIGAYLQRVLTDQGWVICALVRQTKTVEMVQRFNLGLQPHVTGWSIRAWTNMRVACRNSA